MAIYHCHCKVISRGQGRSAVGAAAYRSGEKLTNEYDGVTHDYTNKGGVVHSEILLPQNAPQEWKDRGKLWNEVENIEKGGKARLAREYEVALPRELNREEQIKLVRNFVNENFVKNGMCADVSVHDKGDGNPHAHILLTNRPIEQDGTWGTKQKKEYILDKDGNKQYDKKKKTYKCKTVKTTDWDSTEFLKRTRESWAIQINREMEMKGLPQRVDHRSLADQKKEQIPTEHIGVAATGIEKRGKVSDRGERNREIQRANKDLNRVKEAERGLSRGAHFIRQMQSLDRGEVPHDIVLDTIAKTEANNRKELAKQIQENLDNLSFVSKNKIYSYEQIKSEVTDLWKIHNECAQNLKKAQMLAGVPGTKEKDYAQRIETLTRQLASVGEKIAAYGKCAEVLHRIDMGSGGGREKTFQEIKAIMEGKGRMERPDPQRVESQAVERLKVKMESQKNRDGEAAPPIGGRTATEAAREREAIREKPGKSEGVSGEHGTFSISEALEAQKEAFTESAAYSDKRTPADPAILSKSQELREAVAGLESAEQELKAIHLPQKPSLFAGKAVKEKYERELREKGNQRNKAEAKCVEQFEKVMSFGLSRYPYDRSVNASIEIKPPYFSAEEMKYIKDQASRKLKDLETAAANERQAARPEEAPRTTPERHRAAIERFQGTLREIPEDRHQEARKTLMEALGGYRSSNGAGADLSARMEINEVISRELLGQAQGQEQTRQHVQTKHKTEHDRD